MRALHRIPFFLGVFAAAAATAAIVIFGIGAVVGGVASPADAAEPAPSGVLGAQKEVSTPACRATPSDAATVTALFLRNAVMRQNPVCSYELVTPGLRQGLSRGEWATGNIPVQPFPTEQPDTVTIEGSLGPAAPGRQTAYIVLEAADLAPTTFEVVLVRRGNRWLVDRWAPTAPAPSVPAAD